MQRQACSNRNCVAGKVHAVRGALGYAYLATNYTVLTGGPILSECNRLITTVSNRAQALLNNKGMLRSIVTCGSSSRTKPEGDTAYEGWEEDQASCPNGGPTENQREIARNSRNDRRAEKQCPLAHDASLTGVAGAVILHECKRLSATGSVSESHSSWYVPHEKVSSGEQFLPFTL